MTVNHSEGPALILASERTGTSSHTVRLPRNICTPHKLEQQGATSSWTPTFHQGGDTGLGWSQSTSGRHRQVGKTGTVRHPWEVMVIACHVFWGKKHFFLIRKVNQQFTKEVWWCSWRWHAVTRHRNDFWKKKDANDNQSYFTHKKSEIQTHPHPYKKYCFFTPWDNQGF